MRVCLLTIRNSFYGLLLCLFIVSAQVGQGQDQSSFDVRAHYTKMEVRIPMRDGARLHTVIYLPRDQAKTYPILLNRTPYSVPYGPDNYPSPLGPASEFMEAGFIFAYQDVRGQFMSEGQFVNMRPQKANHASAQDIDESTDTYDTIDWLVKCLPNNNGRVGMWGISYPGFYALVGAMSAHPALKAVSPQAPCTEWFIGDDDHHNGAFFLMDNFAFADFDRPRAGLTKQWGKGTEIHANDAYKFYLDMGPLRNANAKYFHEEIPFWNEMMQHGDYDDFWISRNPLPYVKTIKAAVLAVGGWFDAEDLYGPLKLHQALAQAKTGIPNCLVMGPWPHGGWGHGDQESFGDVAFGSKTAATFRAQMEFPFFNYYLKDSGKPSPTAQVFNTGANRWLTFDQWPPRNLQTRQVYLLPDHRLGFTLPTANGVEADSYVSDPANPVPYSPVVSLGRRSEYMIEDQRFAAKRPDVLTYQTEPLQDDLTVMGPINVSLFASTSGTDADYVVKVIDVYPDDAPDSGTVKMGGYQMMVRGDVMRAKYRKDYAHPQPMTPDRATPVNFEMRDICHTFMKGHKLMVQVQSSWFPLVDRNPQKFVDIYTAGESDFQKATMQIYHSARYPSHLTLTTAPQSTFH